MTKNERVFRIKEVKLGDNWVWTPQFRFRKVGSPWQPCVDSDERAIYRETGSAARHWLFWEDGYRKYPEAGDGKAEHKVMIFDRNGNRVASELEKKFELEEKTPDENNSVEKQSDFLERENILFICDCGDTAHQFVITLDRYEHWNPEVFVEVKLNPLFPFWKRLVHGIKYIFGYKCRFGDFDEVVLNATHIKPLERVVEVLKQLKEAENNEET